MLSVFYSKFTLIFAPECWKCTLRCPDFKIFPGGMPSDFPSNLRFRHLQVAPWALSGNVLSFLYHQLQSFCHLLKTLLKTLFHTFNHYLLIAWYYIHRARSKSETPRLNVFITFFWKLKFSVKEKLLLKPETKSKYRNKWTSLCLSDNYALWLLGSMTSICAFFLFCFVFLLCLHIYCLRPVLIVRFH